MFIEILLAILFGILAGIITGLIPGLHVNLITVLVISLASTVSGISVLSVVLFILSLALTHTFLDSIPSIYLGAPDPAHALSVLPGHQLLHEGKGHQAILYTVIGSLFGLLATLAVIPLVLPFLAQAADIITPYIGYVLLIVIVFLLWYSGAYLKNFLFFMASGLLGLLVFAQVSQEQVLLPLLSGLFGTSTLLYSLLTTTSLPKQDTSLAPELRSAELEGSIARATVVGMLAGFLPGFGASQGAIVALSTFKNAQPKHYLLVTGALNTVSFVFSLVTFIVLLKARNGAIVGISELVTSFATQDLWFFGAVFLLVGGIAVLLALFFSKQLIVILQRVSYLWLVWSVLLFLFFLVLLLAHWQGLFILFAATGLGLLAQFHGAQKNMLLGCLLLPVLLYFL